MWLGPLPPWSDVMKCWGWELQHLTGSVCILNNILKILILIVILISMPMQDKVLLSKVISGNENGKESVNYEAFWVSVVFCIIVECRIPLNKEWAE